MLGRTGAAVESGVAMEQSAEPSAVPQPVQAEGAPSLEAAAEHPSRIGPRRFARVMLLAFGLGLCNQMYWQYSWVDRYQKDAWQIFIDGKGLAPEQYRIGVKMAAWWMVRHLGMGFRHGFLLMDVAATLTALYLLYGMLERRRSVANAPIELKWFASAAFVSLTCFYLSWVGSYFRPETLPTMGLLAVMLWLWTLWQREPPAPARSAWIVLGLIAASAVQAWIRADVALALNAGMAAGCLVRRGPGGVRQRGWKVFTAIACALLAAGTQLYLMRVKYPHASYGPVPVLMILHSWRRPLNLPPFLCFMVPVVWTFVQFWRDRSASSGEEVDTGLVIGSMTYLLPWSVMGKLNEVRVYVPFAMALTPLTVSLALRRIAPVVASGVGQNLRLNRAERG